MSTSIKEEFKRVKAALPLVQRAWLYVKDHPGSTPAKVGAVLKETPSKASGALGVAFQRGMLTRVEVRDSKIKGHPYAYTVPGHMKEYELLPLPKDKRRLNGRPASVLDITPPKAPDIAEVRKAELSLVIDTLTIAEARALYLQLHRMFK